MADANARSPLSPSANFVARGSPLAAPEPYRCSPEAIRVLASVACHAVSGEATPARVFSAHVLGDSKTLERHRKAVERILGPLESLGLRESAGVIFLGGKGTLELADGP